MHLSCATCGETLVGKVRVRIGAARLESCKSCESWTYFPRGSTAEQAALHDSHDYFDHPYFEGRRNLQLVDRRCREVFDRIGLGMDLASLRGLPVLDVGCDTGAFILSASKQYGLKPVGADVAKRAIEVARSSGVEAYHGTLESCPAHVSGFSLITAVDLIEHVADPSRFLEEAWRRLRPGGCLYLETPNIESIVYQLGAWLCRWTNARPRPLFERLFPPQHVQYFTPASFRTCVEACGFQFAWFGLRVLPFRDLSTSLPIGLALSSVQMLDVVLRRQILICALLRKEVHS